jgi:FKBP-type peptidyl-prolyl cis-trans isomerase FklB
MKSLFFSICFITILIPNISMSQQIDSISYSLGVLFGNNIKQQGFENIDQETVFKAMKDVMADKGLKIDLGQASNFIKEEVNRLQKAKMEILKKDGIKFLEENAKREGVTVLESGVQYEILTQGDGARPQLTDQVTTHYHGMLTNGSVFDSSVNRGTPATFPVNGVISGWQEVLQLMPVGSKWKVFIPQDKAYGAQGAGSIPPYSALIFEIELISIN